MLSLSVFCFTNCVTYDVSVYSQIDNSEKTISIPIGGGETLKTIKDSLIKDGWEIFTYRNAGEITNKNEQTEITKLIFPSRYTLYLEIYKPNYVGAVWGFNTSLVDNKTSKEVFNIGGENTYIQQKELASLILSQIQKK